MVSAARIAEVMGGARVLHRRVTTLAELDEAVAQGCPAPRSTSWWRGSRTPRTARG